MKLDFYTPVNPKLAALIEGYYFLRGAHPDDKLHYLTFPNNYAILSVLQNSNVIIGANQATCVPSKQPSVISNLTMSYSSPILVNYRGPVNELTIYFKPAALFSFIAESRVITLNAFEDFCPFDDFHETVSDILQTLDQASQIQALENYLVSKIKFNTDAFLLKLLEEAEGEAPFSVIAERMGMSRQYLHRLFLRYFGKSPTLFRKIHRFRNAVKANASAKNLTQLAYGSLFYDQSHLIRDFKELTHLPPKAFFDKANAKHENVWLYI